MLVKVNNLTSTDNSTAPITIGDTRVGGNGVLTTQVTNSTLIDIDLTFKLDQTQVAKLDLGKQALLAGFTIEPSAGEGTDVHLDGVGSFHFDFGLLWAQKVDTATTYVGGVEQPGPVITFHTPTIDPFLHRAADQGWTCVGRSWAPTTRSSIRATRSTSTCTSGSCRSTRTVAPPG